MIRGIHAEPWDKYVHVVSGKAFVAIVDMKKETFGEIRMFELDNTMALFVPKGFGNSFQALEDTTFLYLVTDVWRGEETPSVVYNDPTLNILWCDIPPIISEKDKNNKTLPEK